VMCRVRDLKTNGYGCWCDSVEFGCLYDSVELSFVQVLCDRNFSSVCCTGSIYSAGWDLGLC